MPIYSPVQLEVCKFDNLYKAMKICRRNVMWKDSVAGFNKNALINCDTLNKQLLNDSYKISPYSIFKVYERKPRIIVSTRFRDRVVQRSLCDNYLYNEITKSFIYDNAACLLNRGTDFARNRFKRHLEKSYRKNGTDAYCLNIDIHDYFGSTLHNVAKEAVSKRISDPWAKQMVFDIIDSFNHISSNRGMGLGSQITQLVQLSILDDLDHKIKEEFGIKYYIRYMDDFKLIHQDKSHLLNVLDKIISELKFLGLEINERKTNVQPVTQGIHFLGFSYRLQPNGYVLMRLLPGKPGKERRKLTKMIRLMNDGTIHMDYKSLYECYISWINFIEKGDTNGIVLDMDDWFYSQFI